MATVELNWSEVCILLDAAAARWAEWNDRAMHGQKTGWRDEKEKQKVLTYQHESWKLVEKLTQTKKGMLNG
jgi:hypothetical protein